MEKQQFETSQNKRKMPKIGSASFSTGELEKIITVDENSGNKPIILAGSLEPQKLQMDLDFEQKQQEETKKEKSIRERLLGLFK